MNTIQPIRHERLLQRDIWVFDGLLDNIERLVQALDRAPFTRTEVATPETPHHRHWVAEMNLRMFEGLPLHSATMQALAAVIPGRRYRPYRTYTNYAQFGDVLMVHTDCQPGADEYTALWFLAREWKSEWGGETLFYDDQHDAQIAVTPRPGRLVIFHGAIPHAGKAPNRICYEPRYSFAIKLEPQP